MDSLRRCSLKVKLFHRQISRNKTDLAQVAKETS